MYNCKKLLIQTTSIDVKQIARLRIWTYYRLLTVSIDDVNADRAEFQTEKNEQNDPKRHKPKFRTLNSESSNQIVAVQA